MNLIRKVLFQDLKKEGCNRQESLLKKLERNQKIAQEVKDLNIKVNIHK